MCSPNEGEGQEDKYLLNQSQKQTNKQTNKKIKDKPVRACRLENKDNIPQKERCHETGPSP